MKTTLTIIGMAFTLVLAISTPQVAWLCLLFWMIFLAYVMCPIKANYIPQYKRNAQYDWYLNELNEYVQHKK